MFPHEEYLAKALKESSSIHQLITGLAALHTDKVNREGSGEEFQKAMHFEHALGKFLQEYYEKHK